MLVHRAKTQDVVVVVVVIVPWLDSHIRLQCLTTKLKKPLCVMT